MRGGQGARTSDRPSKSNRSSRCRGMNEPFEPGQSRRFHNNFFCFVFVLGFFSAHLIKLCVHLVSQ